MRIVAAAAFVIGEGLVVAAWLTTDVVSIVAIVQVLVVAFFATATLAARIVALHARHLDEVAVHTAALERGRIAEEMHDALGHELSLIAVQAGALQLAHPAAAARSSQIRESAHRATLALREIIAIWPDPGSDLALGPAEYALAEILSRARTAGLVATADISGLDELPLLVLDTVSRVVREALTNAGRHGAGPATVTVRRDWNLIVVEVVNPVREMEPPVGSGTWGGDGTGLVRLDRRVTVLGGTFRAARSGSDFTVRAVVPVDPMPATRLPSVRPVVSLRRRWLLSVVGPTVLVVVAVIGYWVWAVHDATTDPVTMGRIQPGTARAAALSILPERQAPVRLSAPGMPRGADQCSYYTNGNFPLGYASWRVCFRGDVVLSISDLR